MPITGSVVDTETVVTLTEKSFSVAFPENNMTIVGILHNAQYVKIPIDSSLNAILPSGGGKATAGQITNVVGTCRRVNFQITGTNLNYSVLNIGTSATTCFYYGTPLQFSKPLTAYAGIVATSTLSGGSGTATLTFPAGYLKMIGLAASSTLTANTTILQATWSVSSGKTFNAYYPMNMTTQTAGDLDILPLDLSVSITVTVTLSLGTGSDVVYIYAFYQKG